MMIHSSIRLLGYVTVFLILIPVFTRAQGISDSTRIIDIGSLPELNQAVYDFVEQNMGKRVGSGQCWDLAAHALRNADAEWDGLYVYGALVNSDTEDILPGDLMQFEGVEVVVETPNSKTVEDMSHHTAIVYSVLGKGSFLIAHQNYGLQKKKIGLTELNLRNITKGEVHIYRPIN